MKAAKIYMKKIKNVDFLLFLVQISDISEILNIILVNHRYKEKKWKQLLFTKENSWKSVNATFMINPQSSLNSP